MGTLIVDEHLEIRDGRTRCRRCGHDLGPQDENYKEHAHVREGPLADIGPLHPESSTYGLDKTVVFRRFACPGCATLLETEVVTEATPFIWDKQISA